MIYPSGRADRAATNFKLSPGDPFNSNQFTVANQMLRTGRSRMIQTVPTWRSPSYADQAGANAGAELLRFAKSMSRRYATWAGRS
jgi:hypothetical protein